MSISMKIRQDNYRLHKMEKRNTKLGKLQDDLFCCLSYKYRTNTVDADNKIKALEDKIDNIFAERRAEADLKASKLVELLRIQTQSLLEQYVEQCIEFADKQYDLFSNNYTARKNLQYEYYQEQEKLQREGFKDGVKDTLLIKYVEKAQKLKWLPISNEDENMYKNYWKHFEYDNAKLSNHRILRCSKGRWMDMAEKDAHAHYENSLMKLASRIQAKNLNQDKLSMQTSHLGVDIETTITDGDKTVRAWTIIAQGEIQRPHYRYLVK